LEDSRLDAIQRLSLAVEARDCVTADHVTEMIDIVERFAVILGYEPLEARMLGLGSSMHDVGKIGIPDSILLKPGPLTHDEREIMQRHCMIGFHILDASPSKVLQLGAIIALSHHERFDGHGYPRGLLGRATPIEARIVQIVDVYSALTSVRPYRDAMLSGTALRMIRDESGTQFDPKLVEAFIENFDAIADTESQYRKTKPPSVASVRQ
jgi:response regulator RpfG family c-di-GMP phosphodiesterase